MKKQAFKLSAVRLVAAVLGLCGLSAVARAETLASPWVEGYNNKVRLIAGKARQGFPWAGTYAGIEIVMPAGWKTYWRNPGEAGGVPPEFDWTGSENLSGSAVLYPAPHRFSDKSGQTIGYKEHVIFPVRFAVSDPAKPVKLKLKATYGACKELCVPAEAELQLTIPFEVSASADLDEAISHVARNSPGPNKDPVEIPGSEDPRLKTSRIDDAAGKPKLVLEVNDPGLNGGDAFLYSPDNLYLPLPKKISEVNGSAVYEADLSDSFNDLKGKSIGVVLTGAKGQSETIIQIPK